MKWTVKILPEDRTVIESSDLEPCAVCGKPTKYIDYCVETRLCSKECDMKYFDEINKMCNEGEDIAKTD